MKSGQNVANFHCAANIRNMGDGPKSSADYLLDLVIVP